MSFAVFKAEWRLVRLSLVVCVGWASRDWRLIGAPNTVWRASLWDSGGIGLRLEIAEVRGSV